jgi:uncharacterized membrane protein YraQ (UPF0718 family)
MVPAPGEAVRSRTADYVRRFGLLLAIAVIGLFIVKWQPYYNRAFVAAANHSLGTSILSGQNPAPPLPSIDAALEYGQRYFAAIWQALVVGLLLAATLETLVPRDWIARVLGSPGVRTSALGGLLALPGMM